MIIICQFSSWAGRYSGNLSYRARGCKLPNIPLDGCGGFFTKNEVSLNYNALLEHGENADVVCHTAYFLRVLQRHYDFKETSFFVK